MGLRGVISSLGAGLSLIIGAVLALTIVSGVVAARGSLGVIDREPAAVVRLPAAPPPLRERGDAPPAPRVRLAAVTARRDGRAPARARTAARPRDRQRTAGEYARRTPARERATPAPAHVREPAATPAPEQDVRAEAPAPGSAKVVEEVAGTVEDVLDPVTGVTEQIVEGLIAP